MAAGFVAVIVIAYVFKFFVKNYRKATKGGLTIDPEDANSQQPKFVPKGPPTPTTKAMMEADPDFNPNNANHRLATLEALDRTSSKLLQMNGYKMGMPAEGEKPEETFVVDPVVEASQSPSSNDLARASLDNLMGGSEAVVK